MASVVSICNQAILSLGGQAIISLDDDLTEAKLCKTFYLPILEDLIGAHSWSFAIKWYAIPKLLDPPLSEFKNAFPLPVDVARVLFVGTDYGHPSMWQVEQGNVVTNDEACKLQAVFLQQDVATYSPTFVQALVSRLSAELAMPLTGSRSTTETHYQIHDSKLRKAITTDGLQGTSRRLKSSWLKAARFSGVIGAGPTV